MHAILGSEQVAFNQLYARHHLLLRKIISQVLSSDTDVEETVQDVFVEIWNRAGNFDPNRGKALGWMICMARRRAVDRLRRSLRRVEIAAKLGASAASGLLPDGSEPGEAGKAGQLGKRDLRRALDGIMDVLPSEQRTVVDLVFFQSLSQRQVAAHTGVPLGTIKTRLQLAMSKLVKRSGHLRADLENFS